MLDIELVESSSEKLRLAFLFALICVLGVVKSRINFWDMYCLFCQVLVGWGVIDKMNNSTRIFWRLVGKILIKFGLKWGWTMAF